MYTMVKSIHILLAEQKQLNVEHEEVIFGLMFAYIGMHEGI